MKRFSLLPAALLAAFLFGLASQVPGQPTTPPAEASPSAATAKPATATNAPPPSTPASLSGYVPDDQYKLRIGDRVSFQIMEDGDPPRSFTVTDFGEINFPFVGRYSVKDKTCKEVCAMLKVELEKEYYYQATPIMALEVANPVTGKIYLWGQVRSQGPLDLYVNDPLTVGKAILRAGGFAEFAKKSKVRLMRGTDDQGQPRQSFELDMDEILDKGKSEKDMIVQPDDFIVVPSRIFNL
jgi:protein involved in polysaccharide export with SLBB domain